MKTRFINHIASIQNRELRETCETILAYPKFLTWPASLSFHHAYEGGLLAHTVEVCDYAWGVSALSRSGKIDGAPWECVEFSGVNRDALLASALWHDVMKMEEYEIRDWAHPNGLNLIPRPRHLVRNDDATGLNVWVATDYQRVIGHICGSAAQFQVTAVNYGVDRKTIDAVTHCILAHHGPVKEWGSPVAPQTLEALILHQADMLSAKFGATKDAIP